MAKHSEPGVRINKSNKNEKMRDIRLESKPSLHSYGKSRNFSQRLLNMDDAARRERNRKLQQ